jgi:hypothetical protein
MTPRRSFLALGVVSRLAWCIPLLAALWAAVFTVL